MSAERKKIVAACAGDIRAAMLTLSASAELMAHGTIIASDVFAFGKIAGYLDAARALVDIAEKSICRALDNQGASIVPPNNN